MLKLELKTPDFMFNLISELHYFKIIWIAYGDRNMDLAI